MPNLTTVTLNETPYLKFSHSPSAAGTYSVTLQTKNNFLDKSVIVEVTTSAVSFPSVITIEDLTDTLTMGAASSSYYTPSISLSGSINIASAGWLSASSYVLSDSSVKIGKIPQSILKNGTSEISSGAEIIASDIEDQTINITEGYNSSRTVVIKSLGPASFANSATTGVTYTDITSSAPVLVSEDYLYVNAGKIGNVKIELAKLIPDDATIAASTGSNYILSGESAYDNDGKLIVGNIPTYTGAYTEN